MKELEELKQIPEQIVQGLNELWHELEYERLHTKNLETAMQNVIRLLDMDAEPEEVVSIVKVYIKTALARTIGAEAEVQEGFETEIKKAYEYLRL